MNVFVFVCLCVCVCEFVCEVPHAENVCGFLCLYVVFVCCVCL